MIPGISSLSLSTGYVLAGLLSCDLQTAPDINVQFKNTPLKIDNTKSSADLSQKKTHSLSPQYGSEFPIVSGVTSGNFQIGYNAKLAISSFPSSNDACLWVKAVNITVIYVPTVYISSDYEPGSCQYDITEEHEKHHVNIDIITINEFLPYIRKTAENVVSTWHGIGPVNKNKLKSHKTALLKPLADALKKVTDSLQKTRNLRQQQVDSRREYRYASTACQKKIPARYRKNKIFLYIFAYLLADTALSPL